MKRFLFLSSIGLSSVLPALTVVSCSDTNTEELFKAKKNIEEFFKFFDDLKRIWKPTTIGGQIPILEPAKNYGFKTNIIKIAADDQFGTMKFRVFLTRGNTTQTIDFKLGGLLTFEKELEETKIKSTDFFKNNNDLIPNAPVITVKSKKPDAKIDDYLKEDKDIFELVDLQTTTTESAIFKKLPPADQGYDILKSNLRPIVLFDKKIGIKVDLELIKDKQSSIVHSLNILGFDEADKVLQEPEVLKLRLNNFINLFENLASPIKTSGDYLDQDPETITTKQELKKFLDLKIDFPDFTDRVDVELVDIVKNSGNKKEGSIKAIFNFKWKTSPEIKEENKEIKLYGFKPVI